MAARRFPILVATSVSEWFLAPSVALVAALTFVAAAPMAQGATNTPAKNAQTRVVNLSCESLRDPVGVDTAAPRLSWQLESATRGQKQTAYRVLVASSREKLNQDIGDLWDTGKVASDQSVRVAYRGMALESEMGCHWKVRVWDREGIASDWSESAAWTMGLLRPQDWTAKWITHPAPTRLSHPWLRHTFDCAEGITRAIIHVETGSFYELHLNGRKIGPHVLTPGIAQTDKRLPIISYDVTSDLVKGRNCVAFWLGPGWHQERMGNPYQAPIVRAQLSVTSSSGTTVIGTDARWRVQESCISQIGTWKWNDFGGERFDAREFIPDWDRADLDDAQWLQAREIPAPEVAHSWLACESARLGSPVKPVKINQLPNGKWVLDFGRPLTGWMRLRLVGLTSGQEVEINYADLDDNPNARKLAFRVNADGYQDFNQRDVFISAGSGAETFCSKFNYHSFRFALIAGLNRPPTLDDAEAMMIEPDLVPAGAFECSHDLFNRIHETTRHTLRTQNPCLALGTGEAREKSAYGDGGAHLSGYLYNFKSDANFKKWLRDWSDAQREDGWFRHTAPAFEDHGGGPAWGGQASELVRRLQLYFGDHDIVADTYDRLRRYVDFLEGKARDDLLRSYTPTKREEKMMFIGDWARPAATPGKGFNLDTKEEREFFNNCYRAWLWQQLQDFAQSLGRNDEVRRCARRLAEMRALIHRTYFQPEKGTYVFSNQSSLAMALYARIPPAELRPKILSQLEQEIVVAKQGHLDTGLVGTFVLLDLLIQENRHDLIALMMAQTTYPGWGYLLKELGLNTWPETWSGWGSHVILVTATPGSWFFEGLGGILPDPWQPGFKHFTLRPAVVKGVEWVNCGYKSPYGEIASRWKRERGSFTWEVTVPPNTTATVFVPTRDQASVTEAGRPVAQAAGVKFLRHENGAAVFAVGSGSYRFASLVGEVSE